jgi:hypothetical protein
MGFLGGLDGAVGGVRWWEGGEAGVVSVVGSLGV